MLLTYKKTVLQLPKIAKKVVGLLAGLALVAFLASFHFFLNPQTNQTALSFPLVMAQSTAQNTQYVCQKTKIDLECSPNQDLASCLSVHNNNRYPGTAFLSESDCQQWLAKAVTDGCYKDNYKGEGCWCQIQFGEGAKTQCGSGLKCEPTAGAAPDEGKCVSSSNTICTEFLATRCNSNSGYIEQCAFGTSLDQKIWKKTDQTCVALNNQCGGSTQFPCLENNQYRCDVNLTLCNDGLCRTSCVSTIGACCVKNQTVMGYTSTECLGASGTPGLCPTSSSGTTSQPSQSVSSAGSGGAACGASQIYCAGCINGCRADTKTCNQWIDSDEEKDCINQVDSTGKACTADGRRPDASVPCCSGRQCANGRCGSCALDSNRICADGIREGSNCLNGGIIHCTDAGSRCEGGAWNNPIASSTPPPATIKCNDQSVPLCKNQEPGFGPCDSDEKGKGVGTCKLLSTGGCSCLLASGGSGNSSTSNSSTPIGITCYSGPSACAQKFYPDRTTCPAGSPVQPAKCTPQARYQSCLDVCKKSLNLATCRMECDDQLKLNTTTATLKIKNFSTSAPGQTSCYNVIGQQIIVDTPAQCPKEYPGIDGLPKEGYICNEPKQYICSGSGLGMICDDNHTWRKVSYCNQTGEGSAIIGKTTETTCGGTGQKVCSMQPYCDDENTIIFNCQQGIFCGSKTTTQTAFCANKGGSETIMIDGVGQVTIDKEVAITAIEAEKVVVPPPAPTPAEAPQTTHAVIPVPGSFITPFGTVQIGNPLVTLQEIQTLYCSNKDRLMFTLLSMFATTICPDTTATSPSPPAKPEILIKSCYTSKSYANFSGNDGTRCYSIDIDKYTNYPGYRQENDCPPEYPFPSCQSVDRSDLSSPDKVDKKLCYTTKEYFRKSDSSEGIVPSSCLNEPIDSMPPNCAAYALDRCLPISIPINQTCPPERPYEICGP